MRLLLLCLMFLSTALSAQEVTYYDADWKPTTKDKAAFYSELTVDKKGQANVKDYYITGELQMSGVYKSKEKKTKQGPFVFYYKNGKISSKGDFAGNGRVGEWFWYHENGQMQEHGSYNKKGLKHGTWKAWWANGNKNYEGEWSHQREKGSWTWYHPNGQKSEERTFVEYESVSVTYYSIIGGTCTGRCGDFDPEYKGGKDALFKYLADNHKYPEAAKALNPQPEGTVWIKFLITKEGKVTDVSVKESVHWTLDRAAMDLVNNMSDWLPALQHNRAVDIYMQLPFHFKATGK